MQYNSSCRLRVKIYKSFSLCDIRRQRGTNGLAVTSVIGVARTKHFTSLQRLLYLQKECYRKQFLTLTVRSQNL